MQPTSQQIDAYQRDGFVIVPEFLPVDEVERLRERFHRLFDHDWQTGVAPDEVNYVPGVTPPDRTRQLCNAWRADQTLAATVLSARNAQFAAALEGVAGMRIVQDNVLWKPPSGRALLAHQDCAYADFLDPVNMTTCWMALDDTAADTGTIYYLRGSHRWPRSVAGGSFHAPDDWLGYAREQMPEGAEIDLVPVEVPAGGVAFHSGWVFHGSPPNERADAERRSVVSHLARSDTRHSPEHRHPVYSRYQRPGDLELELDEAFFPVLWTEDGGRSGFLERYAGAAANAG